MTRIVFSKGAAATSHQGSLIEAQLDARPIWTHASIAQQVPVDAQADLESEMPNQCYQFKEGKRWSTAVTTLPCLVQNISAYLPLLRVAISFIGYTGQLLLSNMLTGCDTKKRTFTCSEMVSCIIVKHYVSCVTSVLLVLSTYQPGTCC